MWSAGSRGVEDPQGSIPVGRGALVREGRSVARGRGQAGAGSRAAACWGAPRVSAHVPLFAAGGWYKGPRFSRLREDRMIFTSSLAAFAHLWGTCPPRLSRSTRGSGTSLGGLAQVPRWPLSAQRLAQRQPDPRPLQQGRQAREGRGHQAPMLGWAGGPRGVGAQRLKEPRGPAALAVAGAALLPPDLPPPTGCWVAFLPALSAGALTESTALQAKIVLARGNYSFKSLVR